MAVPFLEYLVKIARVLPDRKTLLTRLQTNVRYGLLGMKIFDARASCPGLYSTLWKPSG